MHQPQDRGTITQGVSLSGASPRVGAIFEAALERSASDWRT